MPELRKINKKYPTLYKAVSHLPVSTDSKLPVAYVKSLPMIIGVITVFILMILPITRNSILDFSKKSFDNFNQKNQELVDYFSLSMRAGVSSYLEQLDKYINPLPIDTKSESKLYSGRIEANNFSKPKEIEILRIVETAHLFTARVSAVFDK